MFIKNIVFFADNTFEFKCSYCNAIFKGTVDYKENVKYIVTIDILCKHLKSKKSDILQHIEWQFKEWWK